MPSTFSQPQILLLLAISLLLSACSPAPTKPVTSPANSPTLGELPEIWNIKAKLGIRSHDDSASVTLNWQQIHDNYHIRITGPLGQGSGQLEGNENHIRITRGNKTPLYSNQPSQLIEDSFGWQLPLAHLPYWVRGLPSPKLDSQEQSYSPLDPKVASSPSVLSRMVQSGWQVEYSRFKPVDRWLMPHRIRATQGDVRLTLVVRSWEFPNPLLSRTPTDNTQP